MSSINGARKYISRGENVAARMLGGEMMIMSVKDSTLFSLNETASVIWQAADGVTPLREIVEREIVPHFEVDAETAYRDALELAEELARFGILRIADEPAG
ncbi:MAG TPA: PqqD family protein [Candidatus Binataceae bacterium]|nr:PqqD family protein [Candidatus Binataceae bacterium]